MTYVSTVVHLHRIPKLPNHSWKTVTSKQFWIWLLAAEECMKLTSCENWLIIIQAKSVGGQMPTADEITRISNAYVDVSDSFNKHKKTLS